MPLTLIEIVTKFWPFGSWAILCKMIGMLQAVSIFVSTISITAIAFDRYQVGSCGVYFTNLFVHDMLCVFVSLI